MEINPLERILEIKKSQKKRLENILNLIDPHNRKNHAKLRFFMDYMIRTDRERLNREFQKLEREIEELETQISERKS